MEDLFPRVRIALVATMVVLGSAILIGVDGPPSERHVDAASPVASPSPATLATGGAAIASPVAGGTSALVEIRNDDYEPGGLRLSVGDSVRWVNRDGVTHTVSANDGSFDSGPMQRGGSIHPHIRRAGDVLLQLRSALGDVRGGRGERAITSMVDANDGG